jgi:hypothetical protein
MKSLNIIISFLLLSLITPALSQSQNDNAVFSETLAKHLRKFKEESKIAYQEKNFTRGRFLFDSLVEHCLVNTQFDNFNVKKKNGKIISLNSYYKKPIFLMTNTLWCYKSDEEIAAINDLVETYYKDIDFVALFWSTKKEVSQASKGYSNKIHITYINEKMNVFSNELKNLKHSFGFPTYFFINKDRTVRNIIKISPLSPIEQKTGGRKKIKPEDFKAYKQSLNKLITATK